MTTSRSTPRLRFTAALLGAVVLLVGISSRPLLEGRAGEVAALAGLALVVLAVLGRIWSSAFIAGFKDEELVREGPYSRLRHPLYALSWIGMLGLGLASGSVSIGVGLALITGIAFARASKAEDAYLEQRFGMAFTEYRRRTPALLPRGPGLPTPERRVLRPRVFAKSFVDGASFFGAYLLIRLADLLQQSGALPALLVLP
jgi:protein-S-isoprenylcysteine O-methyltransferase Ste14